jgi:hypothetical protein
MYHNTVNMSRAKNQLHIFGFVHRMDSFQHASTMLLADQTTCYCAILQRHVCCSFWEVEVLDQAQQVAFQHCDCNLADERHVFNTINLHEGFFIHVLKVRHIHDDGVGLDPLAGQSANRDGHSRVRI